MNCKIPEQYLVVHNCIVGNIYYYQLSPERLSNTTTFLVEKRILSYPLPLYLSTVLSIKTECKKKARKYKGNIKIRYLSNPLTLSTLPSKMILEYVRI
jgi:hypothetical protein